MSHNISVTISVFFLILLSHSLVAETVGVDDVIKLRCPLLEMCCDGEPPVLHSTHDVCLFFDKSDTQQLMSIPGNLCSCCVLKNQAAVLCVSSSLS